MTTYLFKLTLGLTIKADSYEDAENILNEIESSEWSEIRPDGAEVWETDTEYGGEGDE